MDLKLRGKTAFVSGSTAGIGFAIAQELAREGAQVVVNGRTQERVDAAVRAIGGTVRGVAADLGTARGAERVVQAVREVDILVNNVGIFEAKPFVEIRDAELSAGDGEERLGPRAVHLQRIRPADPRRDDPLRRD